VLAKCTFLRQEDLIAKTLASRGAEKMRPNYEMIALLPITSDNEK